MDLNELLEQQRRYAKVIEDALGPSETIRRQVEQLAGPRFLDDTIRRMMTDVDAGLGHQRLMEQVERITALGAPISRQLKWLEQLQVGGGAVENAKRLLESLPPPITSQPSYSEPRLPMPTMPDLRRPEPEPGPATKLLSRIQDEWNREVAEKQDQRHTIILIVYVPKGTKIKVHQLWTTDGQVVEIEGSNVDTAEPETATVGALSFQFEFVTIEHPPKLRSVK